ncbi:hypothetical protein RN001_013118 [Aquatica leii]|uniref:Protein msta n=1 Tax=Aquatica leii TaxID=1421715 RepID=A0AAN7P2A7_9COLE|nr:hypothetical protein RN001_013118 [Aquatica leii]
MSSEAKLVELTEAVANNCAECQQPAELKCSGCKLIAYCCKEHQKKHWKTHKSECRPFEIQTSPDLGRHLVATRDLNAGDMILCENPLVYGPRPHIVEEGPVPCIGCFRLIIAEQSPRCDGCGWPVCHTSCPGLKDPLNHGLECLILGLRPEGTINHFHDFYRQDTLMVLRCLLLQKKGPKKWEQLMEMEPHLEAREKNTEIHKNVEERIVKYLTENFLNRLKDLERKAERDLLPETSSGIMHKIAGIIDVNALEINQDAELSAIYPTTSLLEHSCVSNTYHVFDDASESYKITVRASIPIKKGEHISTMYTHALWGTQARREHLKETKYFACQCTRCKDPTELGTYLSGLKCLGIDGQPCGGTQLPLEPCNDRTEWACDKCCIRLTNDEVAFLVNKIGEEVDYVQLSNPTVKEMRDLLEKIQNFLHPHHYHVYSVKHSLLQLYGYQQGYLPNQISDELLLKKSEMCRELIEITKTVDPGNARLPLYTSVLLHELFLANAFYVKRKWHVEDKKQMVVLIQEAIKSLSEAKLVLKNESSSAGQKLRSLLASSYKELRNWMDRYKEDIEEIKKEMAQLSLTGLWPINSMIFNDDDFMGSFVTDRTDPQVQMKQCELPSTSITYNDSFIPSISMSTSNVADSEIDKVTMAIRMLLNDIVNRVRKPKAKILSVHIVRPLPKTAPRKTNGKSRLGKSRIHTSTPEKERIQELETMRKQKLERKNTKRNKLQNGGEVNKKVREKGKGKPPKKKLKKIESDSSDSDVDLPQNIVHETKFFDDLSDSLDEFQDNDVPMLLDDDVINCNDYLLVKFPTNKRALHYIGRVESCNNDGSYTVNFLRKYKNGFHFPDLQDISTVSREDIVSKIPNPVEAPGTSRMCSLIKFYFNFHGYNVQ